MLKAKKHVKYARLLLVVDDSSLMPESRKKERIACPGFDPGSSGL
jgi:hypothetical protein